MRITIRRFLFSAFVVFSFVAAGVSPAAALAQDAPSQIGPVTPPASACTAEPRTAEELVALFADATSADPMPDSTTATITFGKPADTASAQQVTALIYQAVACLNAGDFGRFFGLLTDHAIVTVFPWVAGELSTEDSAAHALAPSPPPADMLTSILGIGSISQLPDGSFSAVLVQLDPTAGDQPTALILNAVEQDGVWRIDNAIDFDVSE